MEVIFALMRTKGISVDDVENARKVKSDRKGAFNDKIYLIDVEQNQRDIDEEKELNKEWRKANGK